MSWWNHNGGWNKSHGTVEGTPRVDSFEAGKIEGSSILFAHRKGKTLILDCDHYIDYGPHTEQEIVVLWGEGWTQRLDLTRISSGFGGSRAFWLCPGCGGGVRYLYQTGSMFLCRKCAQLNYKSQQETRSDSMYYYRKGMALVEKRLACWPLPRPDGFSFELWFPDRPRYMHQATYQRYLLRFLRYQRQHEARQLALLRKLLGPVEWAELVQLQEQD